MKEIINTSSPEMLIGFVLGCVFMPLAMLIYKLLFNQLKNMYFMAGDNPLVRLGASITAASFLLLVSMGFVDSMQPANEEYPTGQFVSYIVYILIGSISLMSLTSIFVNANKNR